MTDETSIPVVSRHVVAFIFVTVFLDMVGVGIMIPVLPELIGAVGHVSLAEAAGIGGWMSAAYSGAQFLFGPMMGSLSDRYGRRPLLLVAILGLGLDFVIMALAPNVEWLMFGRVLSGVCGASWVIANAAIADVTPKEKRASGFGILGAAFGLGFIIGPGIGGLLGMIGPRAPFWAAAGISLANFIYGYFVLPETLPRAKRRRFEAKRANPFGVFKVFSGYHAVLPISLVLGAFAFFTSVYPSIWPFWAKARFGWTELAIGLTLTMYGLVMGLFQGALTGAATAWLGERRVIVLGLVCATLGPLGLGVAWNLPVVLALIVLVGPEGFAQPVLTAIATHDVPEDAQGELQGGLSAIMSIAMLLGLVFFAQIFRFFLTDAAPFRSTSIAFYVSAVGIFVTLLAFLWFVPVAKDKKTE